MDTVSKFTTVLSEKGTAWFVLLAVTSKLGDRYKTMMEQSSREIAIMDTVSKFTTVLSEKATAWLVLCP